MVTLLGVVTLLGMVTLLGVVTLLGGVVDVEVLGKCRLRLILGGLETRVLMWSTVVAYLLL